MILLTFLSGAIFFGLAIAGLFFLKLWRSTEDELFAAFALAFFLLAVAQAILALGGIPDEQRAWVYLVRLAAFLILIVAILRKNRAL